MNKLRVGLFILLIGCFGSLVRPHVYAAGPSGLTISPAFQQVSIPVGANKQPTKFTVTNNKATAQTLDLSVADFNTLSETGGLFFIGANPTALQKKYGLAKWVSLPQNQITIPAGQTVTIDADILNLPDLASGGHYGALMLGIAGGEDPNNNVNIHPVASSLLFVTKLGGDTHKLSLSNVDISKTLFKLPSSVSLRFHNDGNTHLIPRGVITITSPTGKLVSKGIINENSGIILPETYRQYGVPLNTLPGLTIPGHYKMEVDYSFDGFNQPRAYQTSFILLPVAQTIVALIVLMLIIACGITFIKKLFKSKHQK